MVNLSHLQSILFIYVLKLATVRIFVIASVPIFVPFSVDTFSASVVFAVCLMKKKKKKH